MERWMDRVEDNSRAQSRLWLGGRLLWNTTEAAVLVLRLRILNNFGAVPLGQGHVPDARPERAALGYDRIAGRS
jgi:hypothetical protein